MTFEPASTAPLSPTPYPDVNAALRELLAGVSNILGEQFRGMYLSGSLALGDFAADRSDIDIAVVTGGALAEDHVAALRAMHDRFNASESPWATEVEAAYIPLDALRRYDPAQALQPHIQRGTREALRMDRLASDWIIQRHILRERGVVVAGPDPRTLIDPIQPDEMRRAVCALMNEWWGPMRDDPAHLRRRGIGYQVYTVLTMCRVLYTLETGDVASKPGAARWVQETLDARWHALIERALAWRKDQTEPHRRQEVAEADMNATLELIEYTLGQCQK